MGFIRLTAVSCFALAIAGAAHAQTAAPAADQGTDQAADSAMSTGLEEIVVTAQKRAENLQNVPIAVTAVSGEMISNAKAVSLQGLQGTIPNIQINNFSNTPNTAVFTIRGIGVIEPDPYAGNTVSIVVDGVPQFFSMGALLDLYDIDRVEVLRGPQGTLFGANTTGGVVNIITAQPTGEFGGKAELSYGNYKRIDAAGVLNFRLSDTLSSKIVVSHNQRDGFVTNVVDGSDMGKRNVTIIRGYLKYEAGDFDATLIGEYDRARNGAPVVVNGALPGEAIYVAPGTSGMYVSPCTVPGQPCKAPDHYSSANNSVPDISDMNTYRGTLTMNLRDSAIGDVTSITGYKKFDLLEFTDQDGTPLFLNDTRRYTEGWQFSQELRTALDVGEIGNIILGGFYMKTHYDHSQDYRLQFAAPGLLQVNTQDQDNWSGSLFAQAYFDLTDNLRAQAGIRYAHEKTDMTAATLASINLSGSTSYDGTGNIPLPANSAGPIRGVKSWNDVGWKIGLDYKPTGNTLLYGYWARGFKSGGFTGRLGLPSDIGPYDPETVDTFEAGFKTDMLDRRLRANFSGFYTNYRDIQVAQIYFLNTAAGPVQGNTILNAAKATIKGFELELTALPAEGLTLTGSLAYLDAAYKDFPFIDPLSVSPANPTGVVTNLKGLRLQNAPEWAATAGATYAFAVAGGTTRAHLLYSYTASKYLTAIQDTPRAKVQATHLVDANIDWSPDGQRWSIGLWGRNLLDNRYLQSVYDSPGYGGIANYASPREYGVTAKVSF